MTRRLFHRLAVMVVLAFGWLGMVQASTVAVVYPEVRSPYLEVFQEIVRGIEAEIKQPVKPYVLKEGEDNTPSALRERMKADRVDVVIGLGYAGFLAAKPLSETFPVVIGAVLLSSEQETQGVSGISLTPDPDMLFGKLKELVPAAKEITVVYSPKQKDWEIGHAHRAAEAHGLNLIALPAEDPRLSAVLFRDVLHRVREDSVAVWLPQNNAAMDEQALLPVVLKDAWEKQFVVFSSSIDHVRKGALFSLYPDNFRMGRSLALMAKSQAQSSSSRPAAIEPLRDVLTAVNLRTAEHLGLDWVDNSRHKFDLTFPRPQ